MQNMIVIVVQWWEEVVFFIRQDATILFLQVLCTHEIPKMLLILILICSEEPHLLLLEIVKEVPHKVQGLFGDPVETNHIQGSAQVFEIQ